MLTCICLLSYLLLHYLRCSNGLLSFLILSVHACGFPTLSRMCRSRRWRQRRKWTFWWAATCTRQHSPPSPSPSPGRRLAGCSEKTKRLVLQLSLYCRCCYHDISSPITTTFTKSAVGHRVSPGCGILSSLPQTGSWKVDKSSGRVRKWEANNARVSSQMYNRMCVSHQLQYMMVFSWSKGTQTVNLSKTCLTWKTAN